MITLEQVKADPSIKTYIRMADASLGELGFTDCKYSQWWCCPQPCGGGRQNCDIVYVAEPLS